MKADLDIDGRLIPPGLSSRHLKSQRRECRSKDRGEFGKYKISHLFAVTIDLPPMLVETDEEEEDKGEEEKREGTKTKHQWFQVLFCFLGVLLKNSEWKSLDGRNMYWMSRL